MTFAVGDSVQPLTDVRFVGLTALSEERVWQLVGGRPAGALTVEQSAALITRLAQSGLFARITPAVRFATAEGTGAILEITLAENAMLRAFEITGLVELTRDEILDALLVVPDLDDDDQVIVIVEKSHHILRAREERGPIGRIALRCPPPVPPRDWLARSKDGALRPGIVWRGLPDGLERVQRLLRREGYLLAQASATLASDGKLTIAIDEGRLESVTIEGVHPAIHDLVAQLLGITTGEVFNVEDLRLGVSSVESRYPFLGAARARRPSLPALELVEERRPDGSVGFTFRAVAPRCDVDDDDSDDDDWRDLAQIPFVDDDYDDGNDGDDDCATTRSWYQLDGRRLIVHFRADRVDIDGDFAELLRHTPVTGFAPGLLLTLHVWDVADRVHFRFDTLFNLNTRSESITPTHDGALGELSAAQRVDFLVAPSLSIPGIGLAELGGAAYTLTDTDDAWRVTALDSYLNSALFGQPERDYFRRTGLTGFITFRWFDAITVGAEYRYDRYDSLASVDDPDTIFSDDKPAATPAVDEGLFGSLLLRVEWASEATSLYDVQATRRRRPSQGPITDLDSIGRADNGLRTVATFELADPALGGDFDFWRVTSDTVLAVSTGDEQGVSLRLRVGGGSALPLQRQEALGGWGSLRGYDFKELGGGDFSILTSLEYRFAALSMFVDAGAVRAIDGDFAGPRLGIGTALNLGDSGQLAFAWRTDDQAEAAPEVRLLFGRPW